MTSAAACISRRKRMRSRSAKSSSRDSEAHDGMQSGAASSFSRNSSSTCGAGAAGSTTAGASAAAAAVASGGAEPSSRANASIPPMRGTPRRRGRPAATQKAPASRTRESSVSPAVAGGGRSHRRSA